MNMLTTAIAQTARPTRMNLYRSFISGFFRAPKALVAWGPAVLAGFRILFIEVASLSGVDEARTPGRCDQVDFVNRFVDCAACFASVKLALQFNEGLIGTVEPTGQDRCNVKEDDRLFSEQAGCLRDVKL